MTNPFARAAVGLGIVAVVFFTLTNGFTRSALAESPSAVPSPLIDNELAPTSGKEVAVFAGGCFWGVQAVFQHTKGVLSATSGYTGGSMANPTYRAVSSGTTGHAEVVKVVFDPSKISYGQLLRVFFAVAHDPTTLNRQGPDVGTQYRSELFFSTSAQKKIATAYIDQLNKASVFSRPIVTKVSSFTSFNVAEVYHQDYATLHPNDMYIRINDAPKVEALRKDLAPLYKSELSSWK